MTKRHAKPTSAQLVARIYRKQITIESEMRSALAMLSARVDSMYQDLSNNGRILQTILYDSKEAREDNLATLPMLRRHLDREAQGQAHLRVTARTLADHCARLLREKETLMKMRPSSLHADYERVVHKFEKPPNGERAGISPDNCSFKGTHQRGVVCMLCNYNGERI